jgi:hypothetical protein
MCLACQMDDELWFAYLDHVAQQEKKAAAEPTEAAKPAAKVAPASPFVCEEPLSE